MFTSRLSGIRQTPRICSKQLWDAQAMGSAPRISVLLRPLSRRILFLYDQILRLLFKLKEDVKGQRNNIEDNLISCDCLCTNMNCHQHYSLQSSNKSVVSFIPSPVFGSLSAWCSPGHLGRLSTRIEVPNST